MKKIRLNTDGYYKYIFPVFAIIAAFLNHEIMCGLIMIVTILFAMIEKVFKGLNTEKDWEEMPMHEYFSKTCTAITATVVLSLIFIPIILISAEILQYFLKR